MLKFDVDTPAGPRDAGLDSWAQLLAAAVEHATLPGQAPPHELGARNLLMPNDPMDPVNLHPRLTEPLPSLPLCAGRESFEDAFRVLALHLRQQAKSRDLRTILVMSAYPKDGRTMTVAHLGLALAQLGSRVVLVDADLRKADLTSVLEVEPAEDVTQAHGSLHLERAPGSRLAVLRSVTDDGPLPPDDDVLPRLLKQLRPLADFVLVDSPPCVTHSDAFFLAPLTDGVLYVVRRRNQDVGRQRAVQADLARLGASMLGVVYNDGPKRRLRRWFRRRSRRR